MTIPRFIHKNILYLHIKTFLQPFDAYQHLYQVDILKNKKLLQPYPLQYRYNISGVNSNK